MNKPACTHSPFPACARRHRFTARLARAFQLVAAVLAMHWGGSPVQAANILWVSDAPPGTANNGVFSGPGTSFTDQGFVTLLQNAGHNVNRFNSSDSQNFGLTAAELNAINTNDLIIIGRATGSAAFQQTGTPSGQGSNWNVSITRPLICMSPFLVRTLAGAANRLGWFAGDGITDDTPSVLSAINPSSAATDYLFGGVNMNETNTAQLYTEPVDRNTSNLPGAPVNGSVMLARVNYLREDNSAAASGSAIVGFPSGTPVAGGSNILAGYRMFFAGGSRESATVPNGIGLYTGRENLTPVGENVFLRAVQLAINSGVPPATVTNAPVGFTSQPTNASVIQSGSATFSISVTGAAPRSLQWLRDIGDGVTFTNIPGAMTPFQNSTLTLSNLDLINNGASFMVVASNAFNTTTSSVAVLTVSADTAPPVALSAGSLNGSNIVVCFDELLDVNGTATEPVNYTVNGGGGPDIGNIVLRPDGKSVILFLTTPIGPTATLNILDVQDRYGNGLTGASFTITNLSLTGVDVGALNPTGSEVACAGHTVQVTGGGLDVAGTADLLRFVYQTVDGDFDARVRVSALDGVPDHLETTAKALLLARTGLANNSANVNVYVTPFTPGDNSLVAQLRTTNGGTMTALGTPFTPGGLPNAWLRLKRVGNVFTTLRSANGVSWFPVGSTNVPMPSTMSVGMGVTSHRAGKLVTGTFHNFNLGPGTPAVVINEWMAVNTGSVLDPADGHPDTWFELFNTTAQAVNLSGWHLTDDPNQPTKFTIPGGVTLAAGGHMVIWADDETLQGGNHVNFTLTNTGGLIALFDASAQLVDSVTYGAQATNISQGRTPDGSDTIVNFSAPTPGAANLTGTSLTAQPVSVTTNCFSTVTFSVGAVGVLPLNFQWHFNCRNIPGANAATLVLTNVSLKDVGQYSVTIGNASSTVSSDDAYLTLNTGMPPVLSVVKGTNVVITWAQTCVNYALEETLSLAPPIAWSPVEEGVQFVGGGYLMSFPLGGATRFFRLASPSLRIIAPPTGRATDLPGVATLGVTAEGRPPLSYQWRLNGFILPDQTNSQMDAIISSPNDYGAYQVTVQDANQALNIGPAVVRPGGKETILADLFSNRALFTDTNGSLHGSTIGATREASEPNHAGVSGGKSVWLSWRAPTDGVAIFDTAGSAFDTLLAVYTGSNVSILTLVGSDDDNAGYLRSRVSFVTTSNRVYHIALDGVAGSASSFLLNWSFSTDGLNNPVIDVQPQDRVVVTNQSITLTVTAHGVNAFTNLSYQWYRNDAAIAGASGPSLDLNNITPADVDSYYVVVANSVGTVTSRRATLQLSSNPQHFFASKILADLICPPALNSAYEPLPLVGGSGGKTGHGVIGPAAAGTISGSLGSFSAKAGCPLGICNSRGYYAWVTNVTTSCGVSNLMTFNLVGTTGNSTLAIYTNLYKSPIKCAVSTNAGMDQPSISFIAKTGFTYQVVISLPSSNTVVNLNFTTGLCLP